MTDRILIRGLEFTGHHGVHAHERRDGCRFRVDLDLLTDLRTPGETDRLADTVDYGSVSAVVVEVGTGQSVWLIERLAEAICGRILRDFPAIGRVVLTLHKLAPPVPGAAASVGVRISRER
jgi:dihydroneopterin aldolase